MVPKMSRTNLWTFGLIRGCFLLMGLLSLGATIPSAQSGTEVHSLAQDSTSPGEEKWAFSTGGTINASPTIGADGTIYVGSQDGNLYSVKPDGMQKRAFDTGAEVNSSPTIGTNGTIYVGSLDGNLYAVHSESGGFATHLGPCSSTISVTVDK